jgi:hypothetical protein
MKAFIVYASLGIAAVGACPSASAFYRLESAVILKSAEPDWDYLTLDRRRGYLFIGRRGDGAAVFDIKTHKVVRTISNSEEAGAIVLVPEFDRGYTGGRDDHRIPALHSEVARPLQVRRGLRFRLLRSGDQANHVHYGGQQSGCLR